MATSPAEKATLGWQSLTTVVTARDTDIDPGITDMSTVEDGVAMLGMVAGTHTGGCNSFTHQSLLSKDTDPFRLDSQFEFSRTYSHQYHYESLMNLAPTGQPFESSYVGFCRIDEGQVGEIQSLLDGLGPTQQLGVIPEPSSNRSPFTRTKRQSQ